MNTFTFSQSAGQFPAVLDTQTLSGYVHWLNDGIIRVQGDDAISFLQGQLTHDFALLAINQARLCAYCSPKGRMLATFIGIKRSKQEIWLICPRELLASTLKRLSMFVLRSKVKLSDASNLFSIFGLIGNHADFVIQNTQNVDLNQNTNENTNQNKTFKPWNAWRISNLTAQSNNLNNLNNLNDLDQENLDSQNHLVILYPAFGLSRILWIQPKNNQNNQNNQNHSDQLTHSSDDCNQKESIEPFIQAVSELISNKNVDDQRDDAIKMREISASIWAWSEVQSGVLRLSPPLVDLLVPQMANYESLDGISFKKGCYTGQEVVARSQFRGTLKRRTYLAQSVFNPVDSSFDLSELPVGTDVFTENAEADSPCGQLLQIAVSPNGGFSALLVLQTNVVSDLMNQLNDPSSENNEDKNKENKENKENKDNYKNAAFPILYLKNPQGLKIQLCELPYSLLEDI